MRYSITRIGVASCLLGAILGSLIFMLMYSSPFTLDGLLSAFIIGVFITCDREK